MCVGVLVRAADLQYYLPPLLFLPFLLYFLIFYLNQRPK